MKLSRSKKAHCFDECIFIILGATGDLTKRKLIPALYQLIADGKLCHFAVIGVSVDATTVQTLLDQAAPYIPKCKPRIIATLRECFYYYQMDFYNSDAYLQLRDLIAIVEKKHKLTA